MENKVLLDMSSSCISYMDTYKDNKQKLVDEEFLRYLKVFSEEFDKFAQHICLMYTDFPMKTGLFMKYIDIKNALDSLNTSVNINILCDGVDNKYYSLVLYKLSKHTLKLTCKLIKLAS